MKITIQYLINHYIKFTIFIISLTLPILPKDSLSCWKFGINAGAGPSYSMYSVKLTSDNKYWGTELFFSPYKFPGNYGANIHSNHYISRGSIRLSPSLSIGYRKGTPPLLNKKYDCGWISANIDLTGYISNYMYLRHQYGFETVMDNSLWLLPSYGIGFGFDFKGALYKEKFFTQNKIFNAVGFGLGSFLIVGINMLYMILLDWD